MHACHRGGNHPHHEKAGPGGVGKDTWTPHRYPMVRWDWDNGGGQNAHNEKAEGGGEAEEAPSDSFRSSWDDRSEARG